MCCICNVININKTNLYFTCALSWLGKKKNQMLALINNDVPKNEPST